MSEHKSKQKHSSRTKMKRMKQSLKDTELRIVAELMKNSRRSDRELAKAIGVSQPTVTRTRTKLENDGVIREYTMIPDFTRLGYTIMGATQLEIPGALTKEKLEEIRKTTLKIQENKPHANLLAVNGLSQNKNRLFITFYENYSDYTDTTRLTRQIPLVNIASIDSFLVDLNDETNYRTLSMSAIANHLLRRLQRNGMSHE
jgi:DNA-binding Lrp family transcriptional regulator